MPDPEPTAPEPADELEADEPTADEPVEPVAGEDGEDLGEVSGGGEITDLGGDSPSS